MTSLEHNKFLAIAFLVYGSIQVFMIIMIAFILLLFFAVIPEQGIGDVPPMTFMGLIFAFLVLFQIALAVPPFVAGYGIWKRKSWAKIAGIIAGALAAMNFPIGAAVCVYAFWFLCGEGGKEIYDQPNHPPELFTFQDRTRSDSHYVSPPQPPNLWE